MNRLASSYVAAALSGTGVIVVAVLAFIALVSMQTLRDWPVSGLGLHAGAGDAGQSAAGRAGARPAPGVNGNRPHGAGTVTVAAAPGTARPTGSRSHGGGIPAQETSGDGTVTAAVSPAQSNPAPVRNPAPQPPSSADAPPAAVTVPVSTGGGGGASPPSAQPAGTPSSDNVVGAPAGSNSHGSADTAASAAATAEGGGEGTTASVHGEKGDQGESGDGDPGESGDGDPGESGDGAHGHHEAPPAESTDEDTDGGGPPSVPAGKAKGHSGHPSKP